jgi:hypothetical protein
MSIDLVWNESAAESIRAACEESMRVQARSMEGTAEEYARQASRLDELAS